MLHVRALWLVVAHDLLEYMQIHGWRQEKTVFFVLLNMVRSFENVCEIISDLKSEWKQPKKVYQERFTKKKNREMEAKRVLDQVENV